MKTKIPLNPAIKRIAFFLFMLLLCHNLFAQISVDIKDKPIREALKEIEKRSTFKFFYNNDLKDLEKIISIKTKNSSIDATLKLLFTNSEIEYQKEQNNIILLIAKKAGYNIKNSKRNISGTVLDEEENPVIGASVIIKGKPNGVLTDLDGRFTIDASSNETLQISYIGYHTKEVTIGNNTNVTIKLAENITVLNDVVVVGYGTQKKGLVTGSISTTKGDDIIKSPAINIGQSLQGRISGVIMNVRSGEPGSDGAAISIRGKSTTGNTDPLILIDGIANRSGNWDRIAPEDIESITVLKDASAAIYGSRSANGVILITTKRGKEGKPVVNYSYNVGVQQPTRLPKMADAATFAQVFNEIEQYEGRAPRYTAEEIEKFKNGSDPMHYPNTDWFKEVLRNNSLLQKHNISIRGGNDKVKYFIGGGYSNQDAIYKKSNTYYNQYNIRSNIDAQITKSLKLSVDLAGRIEDQHYSGYDSGTIFYALTRSFPTSLARYSNGLPAAGMDIGNPVTLVTEETGYRKYNKSVFNSTFTASLDLGWLTKGLSIDGYLAFDKEGMEKKEWKTPFYYYVWDEGANNYEKKKNGSRDYAELRQDYVPRTSLTLNSKINYKRTFNSLHGVDLMLGYEQNEFKGNDFWGWRSNYLSTAIDQLFAGSTDKEYLDVGGSAFEQARKSYFGRFSYDYASKYMVLFNFRCDGSYIFPAGKRWGFFPGVSLGWRISEEKFIKDNIEILDNLKVRASYGQQGNDNVGAFQYLLKYATGRNYVFGDKDVQGVYQDGFPNKDITWEVANTYNLGVEGSLWKGLLGFEIDMFKTKRSNILRQRNASIPQYTGLKDLPDENIGKVQNKGMEIQLNHRSRIGEVDFSASGNFLYARNKVIYMDETPWGKGYDYMKEEGQPLGAGLYYEAIGIFKDQKQIDSYPHMDGVRPGDLIFKDVDHNGIINSMDRVRHDLTNFPEIVFGLNLSASWKNIDVSILLQGQARAEQAVYSRMDQTGNFYMKQAKDRWTPDNPNGSNPRAGGSINSQESYASDFYLKDASFVRLKNLEIGYTLPSSWFRKLNLSNCRIYLSGYNLLTFDKIKLIDPESSDGKGTYYPQVRIFNAGINLTF
jgi:TonB-linked outer membrane protein, SusC/RagA family